MAWRRRVFRAGTLDALDIDVERIPPPGWKLAKREPYKAFWTDGDGDVLRLQLVDADLPPLAEPSALREFCREAVSSEGAGLVEADAAAGADGPCAVYIGKLRDQDSSALRYFGTVHTARADCAPVWTLHARERGMLNVRETCVLAEFAKAGELTVEFFENSWYQDPYDSAYRGVERTSLRSLSDSVEYDAETPWHPLSKVRRGLPELLAIRVLPLWLS